MRCSKCNKLGFSLDDLLPDGLCKDCSAWAIKADICRKKEEDGIFHDKHCPSCTCNEEESK